MIKYPPHIENAITELRSKGFALAIFTPNELQGVDAGIIEDAMCTTGLYKILFEKDPSIVDYNCENHIEEYPD
jgi:hypothetical protein